MRRAAAIAVFSAVLLAACAGGPGGDRERYRDGTLRRPLGAQPGDVVAAELAFARTAQEKGQWTAFAEYASADAVMFVPEPVNAQQWLKGRANPAQSVQWQPHQVWSSCDGSLAVTKGAWQRPDGSVGYFTTVWQRQEDGDYKWVMDQGDVLAEPLEEPDMVKAEVADCSKVDAPLLYEAVGAADYGRSRDNTLSWHWSIEPDGTREIQVHLWRNGGHVEALSSTVAQTGG